MTPSEYTSEAGEGAAPEACSGEKYCGEPQTYIALLLGVNGGKRTRNPKIGDFEAHIRRDQHVLRFYIAVHQPGPVCIADDRHRPG